MNNPITSSQRYRELYKTLGEAIKTAEAGKTLDSKFSPISEQMIGIFGLDYHNDSLAMRFDNVIQWLNCIQFKIPNRDVTGEARKAYEKLPKPTPVKIV